MEPDEPPPPSPRDILKRDQDDALKRPRDEALEKHGADIEAEILRRLRNETRERKPTDAPKKPRDKEGPDMDMG